MDNGGGVRCSIVVVTGFSKMLCFSLVKYLHCEVWEQFHFDSVCIGLQTSTLAFVEFFKNNFVAGQCHTELSACRLVG